MMRTRKVLFITIPIIVFIGIAFSFSAWSSGPAEGTIHTRASYAVPSPTKQETALVINTSRFSVTLPAGFVQKEASPQNSETITQVLATNARAHQQVGIRSDTLPSEGLSGVADYNLRVKDTTTYKRTSSTTAPSGTVTFEDATGSMVTLFWPQGGNYASLTVSGSPGSLRELNEVLSKTLQSWQWK